MIFKKNVHPDDIKIKKNLYNWSFIVVKLFSNGLTLVTVIFIQNLVNITHSKYSHGSEVKRSKQFMLSSSILFRWRMEEMESILSFH